MITLAEVCEKALRLPCSPVLLPRIIEVIAREDVSVTELEKVICLDPVLASSTLRLANSAYFSSADNRVERLEEAIQRLGLREIYRLAALSLAGRWMSAQGDGYRWEAGDFCRMALVTAVAAEYLAEQLNLVDPRVAYTAGLVHEIGKLAVAYSCGEHFAAIVNINVPPVASGWPRKRRSSGSTMPRRVRNCSAAGISPPPWWRSPPTILPRPPLRPR
jgi:HD-like signal output (HDOD) protein